MFYPSIYNIVHLLVHMSAPTFGPGRDPNCPGSRIDYCWRQCVRSKSEIRSLQDGFSVVHSLQSHAAMAAFLKRILLDERGEVNDQAGSDGWQQLRIRWQKCYIIIYIYIYLSVCVANSFSENSRDWAS